MESSVEKEAKTVEKAIELALAELNVARQDAEIEVLEKGSSGFLGFMGGKNARVRVTRIFLQQDPETILSEILDRMKVTARVKKREDQDGIHLEVECTDPSLLIGRKGQNLLSLQYLVNRIHSKGDKKNSRRIYIDIEGYRKRHHESLKEKALRMAQKAVKTGRSMRLEPMSAQDRRVVHMTLKEDRKVRTFSRGEGDFRNVVIVPQGRTGNNKVRAAAEE